MLTQQGNRGIKRKFSLVLTDNSFYGGTCHFLWKTIWKTFQFKVDAFFTHSRPVCVWGEEKFSFERKLILNKAYDALKNNAIRQAFQCHTPMWDVDLNKTMQDTSVTPIRVTRLQIQRCHTYTCDGRPLSHSPITGVEANVLMSGGLKQRWYIRVVVSALGQYQRVPKSVSQDISETVFEAEPFNLLIFIVLSKTLWRRFVKTFPWNRPKN